MRKQYGVIFQAPLCRGHNEEMSLSIMGPFGDTFFVEWYCPHEDVMESCEVRDANLADLPEDLQKFVETRQRRTAA